VAPHVAVFVDVRSLPRPHVVPEPELYGSEVTLVKPLPSREAQEAPPPVEGAEIERLL